MKKNKLALFVFVVVGLVTVLSLTTLAQNPILQDINSGKIVLQNYMMVSSLPPEQRPKFFSDLSNDDKASLMRFHLALQIVKRPLLNQSQKDLILEAISITSAQTYDQTNPQIVAINRQNGQILQNKIINTFQKQEGAEIFASLSGDSKDIEILRKYSEVTSISDWNNQYSYYQRFSPFGKSNIWRIQMAYYLSLNTLVKNQKMTILEALSILNLEPHNISKESMEWKKMSDTMNFFIEQIRMNFSKEEANEVFIQIGNIKKPTVNSSGSSSSKKEVDAKVFVKTEIIKKPNPVKKPVCTCSTSTAPLCNTPCYNNNNPCDQIVDSCGPFWLWTCNGLCQ